MCDPVILLIDELHECLVDLKQQHRREPAASIVLDTGGLGYLVTVNIDGEAIVSEHAGSLESCARAAWMTLLAWRARTLQPSDTIPAPAPEQAEVPQ